MITAVASLRFWVRVRPAWFHHAPESVRCMCTRSPAFAPFCCTKMERPVRELEREVHLRCGRSGQIDLRQAGCLRPDPGGPLSMELLWKLWDRRFSRYGTGRTPRPTLIVLFSSRDTLSWTYIYEIQIVTPVLHQTG
jgi:hypothetical protein